jgi:hypothetical protein
VVSILINLSVLKKTIQMFPAQMDIIRLAGFSLHQISFTRAVVSTQLIVGKIVPKPEVNLFNHGLASD